jgi:hypothetical protein
MEAHSFNSFLVHVQPLSIFPSLSSSLMPFRASFCSSNATTRQLLVQSHWIPVGDQKAAFSDINKVRLLKALTGQ